MSRDHRHPDPAHRRHHEEDPDGPKTPEERAAEVEALAEQLTAAVTELTTSEAWVGMLQVAARFTRYSPSNVLLLWMQAEQRGVTLSRVAGYRAWQAMGRQVVKGARSLAVRAPVRRRLTMEEATERARTGQRPAFDADGRPALVVRGFRLERVFRYEDTEGEPLPEAPEVGYVTGDTPAGAWDALAALVARDGYQLTADPEDDRETRGHTDFTNRIVNIDPATTRRSGCTSWSTSWGTSAATTRTAATCRGRSGRPRPSRSRSSSAPSSAWPWATSPPSTSAAGPTATRTRSPRRRPRSTPPPAACWPTSSATRRATSDDEGEAGLIAGGRSLPRAHRGPAAAWLFYSPTAGGTTRWRVRGAGR